MLVNEYNANGNAIFKLCQKEVNDNFNLFLTIKEEKHTKNIAEFATTGPSKTPKALYPRTIIQKSEVKWFIKDCDI